MFKRSVDQFVSPQERVILTARTTVVPIIFCAVLSILFWPLIVLLLWTIFARIRRLLIVTDEKIICIRGAITDQSDELHKRQYESVKIEQGLLGKLFDCGKVILIGTGGTKHDLGQFDNAHLLRKAIEGNAQYSLGTKDSPQFIPALLAATVALSLGFNILLSIGSGSEAVAVEQPPPAETRVAEPVSVPQQVEATPMVSSNDRAVADAAAELEQAISYLADCEKNAMLAEVQLKPYTESFQPTLPERNVAYVNNALTSKSLVMYQINGKQVDQALLTLALQARAKKLAEFIQWRDYYKGQMENARKWKRLNELADLTNKYWQAQHNVDYFSTTAYFNTLATAALLAKAELDAKDSLSKLDRLTFGILTPGKVERLVQGMSRLEVESVIGPGKLLRTYVYNDPDIGADLELTSYQWNCKDGNGNMVLAFDEDRLYSKNVTWR